MLTYLHAYAPCVQGCPSVMCLSDLSFTPYRRRARTNSNGQTQGPAKEMHRVYERCRLRGCSVAPHWLFFETGWMGIVMIDLCMGIEDHLQVYSVHMYCV